MIIYNGDPHRVRQDAHPAGDGVPTKQSGWRNLLPDLDAVERALKAETASLTSEKRLAKQRTTSQPGLILQQAAVSENLSIL